MSKTRDNHNTSLGVYKYSFYSLSIHQAWHKPLARHFKEDNEDEEDEENEEEEDEEEGQEQVSPGRTTPTPTQVVLSFIIVISLSINMFW